jgi:hypothetical protein
MELVSKSAIKRCRPQTVQIHVWRLSRPAHVDYGADRHLRTGGTDGNSCRFSFKMAAVCHLFEVKNTTAPRLPELYIPNATF